MSKTMFEFIIEEYKQVIQQLSITSQFKPDPNVNQYITELLGKKRCLEAIFKQMTTIKGYGLREYTGLEE